MKRRQLISVLVLTVAVAAILPTLAQGKPSPMAGNDRAHYGNQRADDPQYLLGPGEIPYLSQGIGVTSSELFGVGADDRAHSRATSVEPAPIAVTEDSGWSVDFGNSAVAGLALMLGLLAGGAGVVIWQSRKTRLSPV